MNNLPFPAVHSILSYLLVEDICRARRTCKHWRDLAEHLSLWFFLIKRDLPHYCIGGDDDDSKNNNNGFELLRRSRVLRDIADDVWFCDGRACYSFAQLALEFPVILFSVCDAQNGNKQLKCKRQRAGVGSELNRLFHSMRGLLEFVEKRDYSRPWEQERSNKNKANANNNKKKKQTASDEANSQGTAASLYRSFTCHRLFTLQRTKLLWSPRLPGSKHSADAQLFTSVLGKVHQSRQVTLSSQPRTPHSLFADVMYLVPRFFGADQVRIKTLLVNNACEERVWRARWSSGADFAMFLAVASVFQIYLLLKFIFGDDFADRWAESAAPVLAPIDFRETIEDIVNWIPLVGHRAVTLFHNWRTGIALILRPMQLGATGFAELKTESSLPASLAVCLAACLVLCVFFEYLRVKFVRWHNNSQSSSSSKKNNSATSTTHQLPSINLRSFSPFQGGVLQVLVIVFFAPWWIGLRTFLGTHISHHYFGYGSSNNKNPGEQHQQSNEATPSDVAQAMTVLVFLVAGINIVDILRKILEVVGDTRRIAIPANSHSILDMYIQFDLDLRHGYADQSGGLVQLVNMATAAYSILFERGKKNNSYSSNNKSALVLCGFIVGFMLAAYLGVWLLSVHRRNYVEMVCWFLLCEAVTELVVHIPPSAWKRFVTSSVTKWLSNVGWYSF